MTGQVGVLLYLHVSRYLTYIAKHTSLKTARISQVSTTRIAGEMIVLKLIMRSFVSHPERSVEFGF